MKSIAKWNEEEFEVINIFSDMVRIKNIETGELKEITLRFFLTAFDLEELSLEHKDFLKTGFESWKKEIVDCEKKLNEIDEKIEEFRHKKNLLDKRFWTLKNMIAEVSKL